MKKLTVCAFAMAAMALTMTSCNKEEIVGEPINVTFENTEIFNGAKTHLDANNNLYWDEGDRVVLYDGSNNKAIYAAALASNGNMTLNFVQNGNNARPFDADNGIITAFYPENLGLSATAMDQICIPYVQYSENGEVNDFPMYAHGAINPIDEEEAFQFRNICGLLRINCTTNYPIDSIKVTTDKFITGYFTINMGTTDEVFDLTLTPMDINYGTRSTTLKFYSALDGTFQANIYLPANTYQVFDVTFYSGDTKVVKRNNNPITIMRTQGNHVSFDLTGSTFTETFPGLTGHTYAIDDYSGVRFAQGNLQFLGMNFRAWRLADNQWDNLLPTDLVGGSTSSSYEFFAWGANRYMTISNGQYGNANTIWSHSVFVRDFPYVSGTSPLTETNEWGYYAIKNGGNAEYDGWRTLTKTEMEYIINHNEFTYVTLNFLDTPVSGWLLTPSGYEVSGSIDTKAAWKTIEDNGGVFFPATYYREGGLGTDRLRTRNAIRSNGESYYWMNTAVDNDNAYVLKVNGTSYEFASVYKTTGANVRLVKDFAL